jgi:ubiquinone/menaquinone biosynthesis C-methylase UbiE
MISEDMQTYYGRRASIYDSSMGYDDDAKVQSLLPIIERLRETMRGRHILEIACGPGYWTQFASETAASVVATDHNQSTLDENFSPPVPQGRRGEAREIPQQANNLHPTHQIRVQ